MANLDKVRLEVEVKLICDDICGRCGLKHNLWEACPDKLTAVERLQEVREITERLGQLRAGDGVRFNTIADVKRLKELVGNG